MALMEFIASSERKKGMVTRVTWKLEEVTMILLAAMV
jgi:hypothetical protein